MSDHVHSGIPRFFCREPQGSLDDVTMMAPTVRAQEPSTCFKYIPLIFLRNLPTLPPGVRMYAHVHSMAYGYVFGGLRPCHHSLSYSMEMGLLPNPGLDWWPASPSDTPAPSPQFWVTGVWLHPGELSWFHSGGVSFSLFLRVPYTYILKYESGASLGYKRPLSLMTT